MTENAIDALKIICKNVNYTKNKDSLYDVYKYKHKKCNKQEWENLLYELSEASFILVKNGYIETKSVSFKEIEKYENKLTFIDKIFKRRNKL